MLWGLLAALGWGGADVIGAVSGRRIGSMRTAMIAQLMSLLLIWIAVIAFQPVWNLSSEPIVIVTFCGVLAGLAYLCLYRALELGPIAIVSPVVAAFAGVTIVLALVVLHEHVGTIGGVGIVAALIGVVLASTDIHALLKGHAHMDGGGIPWALGAMLCFGVGAFLLGGVSQDIGPLPATALARTINVITIAVAVGIKWKSLRALPRVDPGSAVIAAAAGATDVVGTFAFAYGTTVGSVSLVTAVSVALVVIPVIAGLVFFKERPAVSQYVGIAILVAGLVVLSSVA